MDDKAFETGPFDTVADKVSEFVASPWVFAALLAIVAAVRLAMKHDEWITIAIESCAFAVVVLIHARSTRMDAAVHRKLNALAEGVAELLDHVQDEESRHLADRAEDMKEAAHIEEEM